MESGIPAGRSLAGMPDVSKRVNESAEAQNLLVSVRRTLRSSPGAANPRYSVL